MKQSWLLRLMAAGAIAGAILAASTASARTYSLYHADRDTTTTRESDSMDHTNLERMGAGDRITVSGLTVTLIGVLDGEGQESGAAAVSLDLWGSTWQVDLRENSHKFVWVAEEAGLQINVYTISPETKRIGVRIMKVDKPAPEPDEGDIVPPKIAQMRAERMLAATRETRAEPGSAVPVKAADGSVKNSIVRTMRPGEVFRVEFLSLKLITIEDAQTDPRAAIEARTNKSQQFGSLRKNGSLKIEKFEIVVDDIKPAQDVQRAEVVVKILF